MEGLGAKLSSLREERHWSKTYVAKKLGMNLPTYANYEYGNREPDLETTGRIAELFGVSVDSLLGISKNKKPEAKIELDLEQALDNAHSFSGKPLSDHDRKVAKDVLRSLFQD